MTTPDFRALCAELADIVTAHANPDDDAVGYVAAVMTRARAALAEGAVGPPHPIPVDERLPGAGDCDAEGRCYAWDWLASDWRMVPSEWLGSKEDYHWWLPAHALPLPTTQENTDG